LKILYLKECAPVGHYIQRTPKEILEEAIGMLKDNGYDAKHVLIMLFDDEAKGLCYRWMQGGGMTRAEMLWHICQMKDAIISGRLGE